MPNDDMWMTCTSCHAVVQLNATGICLGCQGGFAGQQEEDKYEPKENAAFRKKTLYRENRTTKGEKR